MAVENLTDMKESIISSSTEIIKNLIINLLNKLKPLLYILLVLIVAYLLYKLIKFFLAYKKTRREKLTYSNTEKILNKLDSIEKKIDLLAKKPKGEAQQEKPEKIKKGKIKLRKP